MFNFAVERDIVEMTPCYLVKAPAKENRRDRVLSEDEIREFWNKLDNAGMTEHVKLALKLQLVTAQRKGEIVTAEWNEIDMKGGWWVIPAAKAKNGFPHRVSLSKLAILLLERLKEISKNSCWVFPSNEITNHISDTAIDHAVRRNRKYLEKINAFCPHDLRRSAASHMTALGISRLVVSKILNHAERSVTAIYDRHSYDKEKQLALETWSNKLLEIIFAEHTTTNNVILFPHKQVQTA
jgi:integrase